jgi:hypothetical protein
MFLCRSTPLYLRNILCSLRRTSFTADSLRSLALRPILKTTQAWEAGSSTPENLMAPGAPL